MLLFAGVCTLLTRRIELSRFIPVSIGVLLIFRHLFPFSSSSIPSSKLISSSIFSLLSSTMPDKGTTPRATPRKSTVTHAAKEINEVLLTVSEEDRADLVQEIKVRSSDLAAKSKPITRQEFDLEVPALVQPIVREAVEAAIESVRNEITCSERDL